MRSEGCKAREMFVCAASTSTTAIHRMSQPKTSTEPTVPQASPRVQASNEQTRPGAGARFRAVLISGASPQPMSELEIQLRKRLRFCALAMVVYCAADICIDFSYVLPRLWAAPVEVSTSKPNYGILLLIACLEGALAAWLSSRRPIDLARLRLMEWLVMAPVVAYCVWSEPPFLGSWVVELARRPRTFALAVSAPWALLVVCYGVIIPNTWRRCAAGVSLIALIGFVLDVFLLMGYRVPSQPTFLYLATRALWLGVAGSIVVYGSYRIEMLRKEVLEARKLGQYLLKERLGAGGMGEVYRAEHVLLRRPCAIKLIRPERAGYPENLLRFEREVQTTATLTHPNTVQIFDYGHAEDGTFYYVMEHLSGLTLGQLVTRYGRLPAARAVHFLRQICAALREAHGIGLIHRDIKPGNVMVCERGGLHDVVKLLDFGLVLAPGAGMDGERLTQEGTIAGTPAYMSPEQAAGRQDLDPRSDIYSVGCLAYFLLTAQSPFAGRSAVQMLAAHLYEPPAPLTDRCPDVPDELQALVLRCLAKDSAERFASAESLESALVSCPTVGRWTEDEAARWWRCNQDHLAAECGKSASLRTTRLEL